MHAHQVIGVKRTEWECLRLLKQLFGSLMGILIFKSTTGTLALPGYCPVRAKFHNTPLPFLISINHRGV